MNFRSINVVISREYTTRVKKKSFLVTTFLVPVLFAALCCVPPLIMIFNKDEMKMVAVIDKSGIVMPMLESNDEVQWADCSNSNLDSLKAGLSELPYAGIAYITPIGEDNNVGVMTYSEKPMGMTVTSILESKVKTAVEDYRISKYNIDGLKQIMEDVRPEVHIKSFTIGEDGEATISNESVYMILSMVFGIIIFMFVTMFSASVMQSVVEEKQSKVVEVLLSSVGTLELMFGKIVGVALVALTQFLLWIVLTALLVSGVFAFVGTETLMGTTGQDPVAMMSGMGVSSPEAGAVAELAQNPTELQEIMQTIAGLDIAGMLVAFLFFFIFGYLLYASMFAAIGSATESMEESNNLQMPLTLPLMLGYFIALYSWNAPDSALAVWGSMIPFTSPIVMLARIPFGVPVWEIVLSLGILFLTFCLMAWLSARIYRVGILSSGGKKTTWKDIFKWITLK